MIYSIGSNEASPANGEIQQLNIGWGNWTTWSNMLTTSRTRATCQIHGDQIFVFGGISHNNTVVNIISVYNITNQTCTEIGPGM